MTNTPETIEERLDRIQRQEAEERIYANIPPRFKNAKLSDFTRIDPILEWIKNPANFLLITGPCGTGKTHLACAITIELRKKAIQTRFVVSANLFLAIRRSFNNRDYAVLSEYDIVDSMVSPPVLVCDDIGVQKQSEFVIETWYTIIDSRYRDCKPTVFTSNLSLKEISLCLSDRVASRLASGVQMNLHGKDRRVTF
jgi:DNA replication protein DnaC